MASSQIVYRPQDRDRFEPRRDPQPARRAAAAAPSMFVTLDQATAHRDPKATILAATINITAVACLLWLGATTVRHTVLAPPARVVSLVDPVMPPPPRALPKPVVMSGGGGHPMAAPVTRGNPPKFAPHPVILTATDPPRIPPKLAVEPTLNVQPTLKLAKSDMPNIGVPDGHPAIAVSMGNGAGAGIGAGSGDGLGNGSGGNYGGGVFKIGGGVSAPTVVSAPEPAFTEEARQAKVSGKVLVYLQVGPDGRPMHVRVVKGLGMGLDQKAVEAVRQYKFKPAMRDGHPVTVEMNVDVNFQIL